MPGRPARPPLRHDGGSRPLERWLAGGLLSLHFVVAFATRSHGVHFDDLRYLLLARSLRDLQYVNQFEVGSPAHVLYPPGYPAILAVLASLVGERVAVLVVASVVASTLGLLLAYLLARRFLPLPLALASLALLVVHPTLVQYGGMLMAEAPYMALSIAALWLLTRDHVPRRALLLAAVAAVSAALVRSVGLSLVAAIGIWWTLEGRWRGALGLSVAAACTAGLWLLYSLAPRGAVRKSYGTDLGVVGSSGDGVAGSAVGEGVTRLREALSGAVEYLEVLPASLGVPTPDGSAAAAVAIGAALVGLVVVGLSRVRPRGPVALYLTLYGGILLVWPWVVPRLLHPLLPLLVPLMLAGAWSALDVLSRRWAVPVVAAGGLLLAVHVARELSLMGPRDPRRSPLFPAYRYIGGELPADAVILSLHPEATYFYAGRRGVSPEAALAVPRQAFVPALRDQGVTHILLRARAYNAQSLFRRSVASCASLAVAATFPRDVYLLEIAPADQPPARSACATLEGLAGAPLESRRGDP